MSGVIRQNPVRRRIERAKKGINTLALAKKWPVGWLGNKHRSLVLAATLLLSGSVMPELTYAAQTNRAGLNRAGLNREIEGYQLAQGSGNTLPPPVCTTQFASTLFPALDFNNITPANTSQTDYTISNIATWNGQNVDMLVTFERPPVPNGGVGDLPRTTGGIFAFNENLPNNGPMEVTYTFVEAGTSTPILINAILRFADLDVAESLTLDKTQIDGYNINNPTNLSLEDLGTDYRFSGRTGFRSNIPNDLVELFFVNRSSLTITYDTDTGSHTNAGFGLDGQLIESFSTVACQDFGDAPDSYGDSNHLIPASPSVYLGSVVPDNDINSRNTANGGTDGTGDNNEFSLDEDGVTLPPTFSPGDTVSLPVAVNGNGVLNAWIDWDGNGTFDAGEEIATDAVDGGTGDTDSTADGTITLSVTAPVGATVGNTFARFRYSSDTGLGPTGAASDGEVEDYQVAIATTLGIYGTVFEDVNYGGGTGRDFATSSGVGRDNVRVELYDAAGAFVAADLTDANGLYEFTSGLTDGQSYTVRVVNDTVTSSRSLNAGFTIADTVAVQTYRYDPDETTPAITNEVGGIQPAFLDSGANTTSANLSTLTTATTAAQSASTFTLSGSATNVDFGFNFDTIVNTNGDGQGSLFQFVSNSNALDNTGLAQDLPAAITAPLEQDGTPVILTNYETSIFMIPDPNTDARVTTAQTNLDTTPPDGGTGSAFVIDTSVAGSLVITDPFTSIDGRTQSVNIPSVSNPPNLTVGANETTGVEVIIQKTSNLDVLTGRASNTIVHSVGVVGNSTPSAIGTNTIGMIFANNGTTGGQTADTSNIIVDSVTIANIAQCGVWGVQMVDSVIRDSVIKDSGGLALCDNIQLRRNSDRNLIDNNLLLRSAHYGIDIVVTGNSDNVITNNQIIGNGINDAGQNAGIGLRNATGTLVQNNIIRDSIGGGVDVSANQTGNRITQNSIFNNGELGIDLDANGPTLNDAGDSDGSGNLQQNFPVITAVTSDGTTLTVQGTLNSTSSSSFDIELYSNAVCNPGIDGVAQTDTYGEGEKYHTTLPVATDGSGDATFSTTIPVADLAGSVISATATDATGNTSEFSECPVASDPNVLLVKRMTAINRGGANEQLFDTSYVNGGTASDADNETNWPGGTETAANGGTVESYINGITSGTDSGVTIQPGDEIEYTISFLSNGDVAAQNMLICDRIPANTTFIPNAFNSSTPATANPGDRGIFITVNGSAVALTNANDGDEIADTGSDDGVGGYYFPAGTEPSTVFPGLMCNGTNTNGAIVVDVSSIPRATGDGVPTNAYGFIQFRAVVD